MEQQDFQLLDQYFNGLLSEAEQEVVLKKAAAEPAFGQAFELRRQLEDWPRREALRQAFAANLPALGDEFFQEKTGEQQVQEFTVQVNRRRWWLAAAAVLILLSAALWFFNLPQTSLYQEYAQYSALSFTERGSAVADAAAAETAFNARHYPEALEALDRLLAQEPANAVARLYRGLCLLELRRPADAREALLPLVQGQTALRADAQWYVALSYLLEDNPQGCQTALQQLQPGEDHYEAAQDLLQQLR
ncbi:MAG: hypothetical protein IT260_05000 [Saprospiraceae bacterium]|nr:hypothetical protein [Saprospiraceae bacterium]